MSETLTGPSVAAASGAADSQILLLHGYGADGADLAGLGEVLKDHLPDTRFLAPNAPERCTVNPTGYQWFPIPWMDGSTEVQMGESIARSADLLDRWLTEATAEIPAERTVVVGFSQGTMMALHVVLRRETPPAGLVGFSGRLIGSDALAAELRCRPPVLLIHGDMDDVVPFGDMKKAAVELERMEIDVRTHVSRGAGHTIAPDGLGAALAFAKDRLG